MGGRADGEVFEWAASSEACQHALRKAESRFKRATRFADERSQVFAGGSGLSMRTVPWNLRPISTMWVGYSKNESSAMLAGRAWTGGLYFPRGPDAGTPYPFESGKR